MHSYNRLRLLCCVIVACCGIAAYGPSTNDNTSHVVIVWALMSVPWLTMISDMLSLPNRLLIHARRILLWTFISCSALLFLNTDVLSDDAHRYRWDGLVAEHGINPYAAAPSDSTLEHLGHIAGNVIYPTDINNNSLKTIYPPGAQIVFQFITKIFGTHPLMFKLGWISICMVLIAITLALTWNTPHIGVYYLAVLISPIMLLHGFLDIHVDILMALVVGAVLLPSITSFVGPLTRSAGFAFAVSLKYLPLILMPLFLLRTATTRRVIALQLLILFVVTALLYVPYLTAGMHDSLGVFAAAWQSNSLLASLLQEWVGPSHGRIILAVVTGIMCLYCAIRYRKSVPHATSLVVASIFVFSPVVHPWYLAVPLILWVVAPSRTLVAWACTMFIYGFLYMLYKNTGRWIDYQWLLVIEYLPVFIAYWFDLTRGPWSNGEQHRTMMT